MSSLRIIDSCETRCQIIAVRTRATYPTLLALLTSNFVPGQRLRHDKGFDFVRGFFGEVTSESRYDHASTPNKFIRKNCLLRRMLRGAVTQLSRLSK